MKVTGRCKSNELLFICDHSPPRSADLDPSHQLVTALARSV